MVTSEPVIADVVREFIGGDIEVHESNVPAWRGRIESAIVHGDKDKLAIKLPWTAEVGRSSFRWHLRSFYVTYLLDLKLSSSLPVGNGQFEVSWETGYAILYPKGQNLQKEEIFS